MKLDRVSATKLESFVSCPYRYYLKYVKGVATGALSSDHMLFGTAVHKVMEEFHDFVATSKLPEDPVQLKMLLLETLRNLTAEKMGMLSSNHPGTMRKLRLTVPVTFADYMLPYFEHFMAEKWYLRRMEPEKEFKIPLGEIAQSLPQDKLHPLYETYKHIEVQGKMDLVLYPDTIIDFKTQASAPGPATLVKNFQTNLYTLIFDKDMTFLYVYLFRRLRIKELKILGADRIDKFNALVDFINIVATAKSYNRNPKSCYMCVFRKFCKIV